MKKTNIIRSGAKWLPGSLALAATATTQAATVQIAFGKFVDHTGTKNFLLDVGGDGINDLKGEGGRLISPLPGGAFINDAASVNLIGGGGTVGRGVGLAYVGGMFPFDNSSALIGSPGAMPPDQVASFSGTGVSNAGFVAFTTTVQGLGARNGWLEVKSASQSGVSARVDILRFVFSDSSVGPITKPAPTDTFATYDPAAVPEPSSIALLACGAAGLIARRRRNQAA